MSGVNKNCIELIMKMRTSSALWCLKISLNLWCWRWSTAIIRVWLGLLVVLYVVLFRRKNTNERRNDKKWKGRRWRGGEFNGIIKVGLKVPKKALLLWYWFLIKSEIIQSVDFEIVKWQKYSILQNNIMPNLFTQKHRTALISSHTISNMCNKRIQQGKGRSH